jgi:hypothetical protein
MIVTDRCRMIWKIPDGVASTLEPSTPAPRVTLRIPTTWPRPRTLVLREEPKPTHPRGRIPRVARLLALAYHFQELLDTAPLRLTPSWPSSPRRASPSS